MTAENEFIKKLETFFDQVFNDYSKRRIFIYLEEYKNKIPPIIIKQNKESKNITYLDRSTMALKSFVDNDKLMQDAVYLCKEYNIEIFDFMDRKHKKCRTDIVELRKKFCQDSFSKYVCSNNILSKFFNIHNSTISFYLYGKKHLSKTSTKTIKQL